MTTHEAPCGGLSTTPLECSWHMRLPSANVDRMVRHFVLGGDTHQLKVEILGSVPEDVPPAAHATKLENP